ncbi:MAG: anti-phage ZorAB system protein ZorA [Gammaproteobacteria bacterium]|nr:anti-phage ZorAB system protein ZorA [Gammaproteobacteria bacterium]
MTDFLDLLRLLLPWPWSSHNLITNLFIYVIFLSFLYCLVKFLVRIGRRGSLIHSLTMEVNEFDRPAQPEIRPKLKISFQRNDELAEAWQEFDDSLITDNKRQIVYKTEEASVYFSEERLLAQHLNLRFWNSVPTILVGLGILGTFIGMVSGLMPFSEVDFTQTQTGNIQEAIKGLLTGVSIAFVTSVWGMLTSLVFNVIEKARIGNVGRRIAYLQRVLDEKFTLTTQEEISFRQEDELAQQTQALKSFSTDLANEIKSAMAQGRQEIITELRNAPDAFSNAMSERLAPSLDDLNDAVKELHTQKEESSTEAIGKLIEVFQDSISGNTVRQMETLATTVDDVSQSLKDLPAQMADMMTSVQDKIDQTSLVLSATSEEQMGQTKSMLDGMLNAFQNAIDKQQDGLTETTDRVNEEMRQIASDIRNLLESVANQTNDQLSRRIADFESVLDQQKQAIEEITAGTTKASEESADRMRQFVEHSVTRLGESVQDVEQSVGGLLQRQHGQIEAVDAQLASFRDTITKGQEMLQQMNASAASVRQLINTTQEFSRKLATGSERLESAGKELTQASNAFKEENHRYLTANRETTKQIQESLVQSEKLLNDFTRRFQTIDNGLKNIFAEIESGLTTYATTSRESINEYLGTFSDQLTNAANALSGSVQALNDSVDELTEMNERLRQK